MEINTCSRFEFCFESWGYQQSFNMYIHRSLVYYHGQCIDDISLSMETYAPRVKGSSNKPQLKCEPLWLRLCFPCFVKIGTLMYFVFIFNV